MSRHRSFVIYSHSGIFIACYSNYQLLMLDVLNDMVIQGGPLLKTRLLKNIFIAAVLLAAALLIYIYAFVHPAYRELLIENAEDEAVRFASFLISSQNLDKPITLKNIPADIAAEVGRLHGDEMLIKLRIFSPGGNIVYSTLPKEIGTINKHSYFHDFVASGNIYSKTVQKNTMTAEMEIVSTDLVETYVPIMSGDKFIGAIETYYDITTSSQKITALARHSLLLLVGVSMLLLALLYYALHHADISIQARKDAENNLLQANEELEARVIERAGELVDANESLTREIAERTLAQMALSEALSEMREDKEKISGILRSVDDGLLVINSDKQIVLMNAPAENILGISQQISTGLPLDQASQNSSLNTIFPKLLNNETAPHLDFELSQTDTNRKQIYQARTSQLRDENGSIQGTVILMQDVTQERELDQMKADFLAMAAHELSTPLTTIIGYADLLAGENAPELSPEIQRESLDFIHDKANALSRIVDDLLDVNRIESGQKLSINTISFDLCQALELMVKSYNEIHTGHTILLDQCNINGEIHADPIRIGQVLENIMSNAVKYTPTGGQINISCIVEDGFTRVEIRDNGVGMTPEQLEHVFDKFYRADASNTAKPGVGLGMSITKHIIESHGGTIAIQSDPGQGTRVTFYLPFHLEQT